MPVGTDWNLLFILLFLPSVIADYRQYIYPNIAPWSRLTIEMTICGLFILWLSTRQILNTMRNTIIVTYSLSLISAIIAQYQNMEMLGYMAHHVSMEVCGCGVVMTALYYFNRTTNIRLISKKTLTLSIVLALLSNNWSDTWSAILDGQIRKSFLDRLFLSLLYAWSNLMVVIMLDSSNARVKDLVVASFCVAASIPILAIFSPYSSFLF